MDLAVAKWCSMVATSVVKSWRAWSAKRKELARNRESAVVQTQTTTSATELSFTGEEVKRWGPAPHCAR
jgi:hypothetical protein